MARKLAYHVHLEDETGNPVVFGPDSTEIPGWARKKITNPSAWGEGDDVDEDDEIAQEISGTVAARQASAAGAGDDQDEVYTQLTAKDLQAEVDRRNEAREDADKIAPGGKSKAKLIDALKGDDQAALANA